MRAASNEVPTVQHARTLAIAPAGAVLSKFLHFGCRFEPPAALLIAMDSNPVPIEELLAHAGWVRKLAGRLVRDAAIADDVSQEVWAQALRAPPRDRTNLRGWLAAAVRNSVRTLKRAEVRRSDREAALELETEEPSAGEIVERAQLHRRLVEHVLALDEPQRSIVLAHWFEGESIAEIARRHHMTARVVKLRLDAAHATLRQRMDASSGRRAVWCGAFAKWLEPTVVPAATKTAFTIGGIAVASKLVIGSAVVVVAAGLGWYFWPALEPQTSVASAKKTTEPRLLDAVDETKQLVEDRVAPVRASIATSSPQPSPVTHAASAAPRWFVRGTVRGAPAGRESETKLTAQAIGMYSIPATSEVMPAADGSFEIDLTALLAKWSADPPSEIQVTALHPECLRKEVHVPYDSAIVESSSPALCRAYLCDVDLVTAAVVTGRVVLPPDESLAVSKGKEPRPPRVCLFEPGIGASSGGQALDSAVCDASGYWTLRASHGGTFTVIALADSLRPASIPVVLTLGSTTSAGIIGLERGGLISGVVRRQGRAVGAGYEVLATWKGRSDAIISIPSPGEHDSRLSVSQGAFEYREIRTLTRADGSYVIEGLAAAEYELRVERVPDVRSSPPANLPPARMVRAPASGVDLVDVPPTLDLSVTVSGRAPTNVELEGAIVELVWKMMPNHAAQIDLTNTEGRYGKIQLGSEGEYELRVPSGRYAPKITTIGPFECGEEHNESIDLVPQDQGCSIVVRLVTDNASTLNRIDVAVQELQSTQDEPKWRTVPCKDGKILIRDLPAGSYRVHVHTAGPYDGSTPLYFLRSSFDVVLPPKTTVEHELRPEFGGRIRVSVKNAHGDFVQATVDLRNFRNERVTTDFYCLKTSGLFGCADYVCAHGINDHPPLPVGHYELSLGASGLATQTVPFDVVAGETQTLEVVLQPR